MKTRILKISLGIMLIFTISNYPIYAQEQSIDEFLEWPTENNYNFLLLAILVLFGLAIMANYLWSRRKGRRYSEE